MPRSHYLLTAGMAAMLVASCGKSLVDRRAENASEIIVTGQRVDEAGAEAIDKSSEASIVDMIAPSPTAPSPPAVAVGNVMQRFATEQGMPMPPAYHDVGRDQYDAIWIESAIARLKPALRDAAVLVAGQQMTHAEAAAVLGVAEATVSWRMHEVRRMIGGG